MTGKSNENSSLYMCLIYSNAHICKNGSVHLPLEAQRSSGCFWGAEPRTWRRGPMVGGRLFTVVHRLCLPGFGCECITYSKSSYRSLFQKERCKGYFLLESLSWGGGLGVGQVENEGRACKGMCLETLRHNMGTR